VACLSLRIARRDKEPKAEPSYLLKHIQRAELDLALMDRITAGTFKRRSKCGVPLFKTFLESRGWTLKKAGCSEFLVDKRWRPIADPIAASLVADYALHCRKERRDVDVVIQALRDDFIGVGRDVDFLKHPLVQAARKKRSRRQGREDGRKRLQNKREAVSEEMMRWGLKEFMPDGFDLRTASPLQWDDYVGCLAGFMTFNWPNVRISNQACAVSKKQAYDCAKLWSEANSKAGRPYDFEAATQWFRKGHSLRASDLRIGSVGEDGIESWMDPMMWISERAAANPIPQLVALAVMSAKKNQNGNRPQIMMARASKGFADRTICRGLGQLLLSADYGSLEDLLLSRLSRSWEVKAGVRGAAGARRELPTAQIGRIAKKMGPPFNVPARVLSANSFKMGAASAVVTRALLHAKRDAQKKIRHKSRNATEHYIRLDNDGGDGVAAHWDLEDRAGLPTHAVRRGAAVFRD